MKKASRVKFRDWERNRNFKLYLFMSLLNSHNDGEFGGNENRGFSRGSGLMKEWFLYIFPTLEPRALQSLIFRIIFSEIFS